MSNKIVMYAVIESYCIGELVSEVNDRIDDGWQPYGSLAMTEPAGSSRQCMVQPMVLYQGDL